MRKHFKGRKGSMMTPNLFFSTVYRLIGTFIFVASMSYPSWGALLFSSFNPSVGSIVGDTRSYTSKALTADMNGDGQLDLVVCDRGESMPGQETDRGRVAIFTSLVTDKDKPFKSADIIIDGPFRDILLDVNETAFGISCSLADINKDGLSDLLVGAPYYNEYRGAVYVIFGSLTLSTGDITEMIDNGEAIQWRGESEKDFAGFAVSGAGDMNGDGYDDVVVGAHFSSEAGTDSGSAYIILGSPAPSGGSLGDPTIHQFVGEQDYGLAGLSVSSAGDVNRDGYDDVIIGSPYAGSMSAGTAYLIQGSSTISGGNLVEVSDAIYLGENAKDAAGWSVSGGGDVNKDGYDDLVIGAINGANNRGAVYVILGSSDPSSATLGSSSTIKFEGQDENDWVGSAVSLAGDLNGDGYDDVLIGAPGHFVDSQVYDVFHSPPGTSGGSNTGPTGGKFTGVVYLIQGSSSLKNGYSLALRGQKSARVYKGRSEEDWTGEFVGPAGDYDRDGRNEFIVGSQYNSDGGRAFGGKVWILNYFESNLSRGNPYSTVLP